MTRVHFGRHALFAIWKRHYEALLAEAARTGVIPREAGHRDPVPPVRYAFYWQRGVTDNWAGVVYDPSGELMQVNRETGPHNLHDLFGDTFYHCEALGDDWYLCWFT